jgi:hypothetical protein
MSEEYISLVITNKLKHLLNNVYQRFKLEFPNEEPGWNIRCFRKKQLDVAPKVSRSDLVTNWRLKIIERTENNQSDKVINHSDMKERSAMEDIKLKASDAVIHTRTVKRVDLDTRKGIISKSSEVKNHYEKTVITDVMLNPNLDQIHVDMDISQADAPVLSVINPQFQSISSSELYGVSLDKTIITNKEVDFSTAKSLIGSLKEIVMECETLSKSVSVVDDLSHNSLKNKIMKMTQSNMELQEEIKSIRSEMYSREKMIMEEKIDVKLLTRVEGLLGHKAEIGEIIAKYVAIQDKLHNCKSSISNTLSGTNLDYKSMYKEYGFIESIPWIIKKMLR